MGWIIDSVVDHIINISKYNPLTGTSYFKLPKKLDHPGKGLVNIQSFDDNQYFKWYLIRYLHRADYHASLERLAECLKGNSIWKIQNFQSKLKIFTKLKNPVISALAFLVMKTRKNIQSMRQEILSKNILIYYYEKKK